MNAERLIRMIFRRLLFRGMNAGIDRMARNGDGRDAKQAKDARRTAKRARQAARITRRMGRF